MKPEISKRGSDIWNTFETAYNMVVHTDSGRQKFKKSLYIH